MRIYTLILALLISTQTLAQDFWATINEAKLSHQIKNNRTLIPEKYHAVSLDLKQLKSFLSNAPLDNNKSLGNGLKLDIPMPDGSLIPFKVVESPSMMPGIQARYPDIRSYRGKSLDGKIALRFDISMKGLRAGMRTVDGTVYIDPYADNDIDNYISYYVKDHKPDGKPFQLQCGTADHDHNVTDQDTKSVEVGLKDDYDYKSAGEVIEFRTYRMAFACTGEWGASQGSTIEEVLASINSSMNRMNLIFENDLALRMQLVDRNDEIIYIDGATDPYPNHEAGFEMLGANTNIINNKIGRNSYDIGHIFARCTDTGGVAFLQSACRSRDKAGGVTCDPRNSFNYRTVSVGAHEIGHQMGASHTFNQCSDSSQFSSSTSFEPGSGSTIMSYAGLCGSNNIQGDNHDYYHSGSLTQMFNYMRNGNGDCGVKTDIGNSNPDITIETEDNMIIPMGTPFVLDGSAVDAEDDSESLTYTWEQYDLGPSVALGEPTGNVPLFRSIYPNDESRRYLPSLSNLLKSSQIVEVLPEYARDLTFRLVVRDNNELGGAVHWETISMDVTDEAGPFEVTFPNTFNRFEYGEEIEVTWDVANTDGPLINCQKVDIVMSINGGYDYDHIIIENTENDGRARVVLPNEFTVRGRIMIRARDHIFFDISNTNFHLREPEESKYTMQLTADQSLICLPDVVTVDIETFSWLGYDSPISFDIAEGLPEGAVATFSSERVNPSQSTQLTIDMQNVTESGDFSIKLRGISDSGDELIRSIDLKTVGNDFSDMQPVGPVNGMSETGGLPEFSWTPSAAAQSYNFQLATNPSFAENTLVMDEKNLTETSISPSRLLDLNELYYWRVSANNLCGSGGITETQAFHTVSLSCSEYNSESLPLNISASGTRTVEAHIEVFTDGTVSDVNVKRVRGSHEQLSDLSFTLISPAGTEVVLAYRKCGNLANFDAGFDDDSPLEIQCPMLGNRSFIPQESLSAFNGENQKGRWTLRIDDLSPGAGGSFNEFKLEICGSVEVENPVLVNNVTLEVAPYTPKDIRRELLLATDSQSSSSELTYTLVTTPTTGGLYRNGSTLLVAGDTFTQADINGRDIVYLSDRATMDSFDFVVEDTEGGWISITKFLINVNGSFTTSTEEELADELGITLFPNPAQSVLNVTFADRQSYNINMEIIDVNGRVINSIERDANQVQQIDLSNNTSGIYFLKVIHPEGTAIKKFLIQK